MPAVGIMAAAEMDIGTSALAALARTTYQTDLAGRKSCWGNETAKLLGITVQPTLLVAATEVIE
jgi:hypothetical protein